MDVDETPNCPHCGAQLQQVDCGHYVVDIHGVCVPCGYSISLETAADCSAADYR